MVARTNGIRRSVSELIWRNSKNTRVIVDILAARLAAQHELTSDDWEHMRLFLHDFNMDNRVEHC